MPANSDHLSPNSPLSAIAERGSGGEVRLLFLGDIVGKPGRKALQALLPALRKELQVDVVLANLENIAHGKSLTSSTLAEVLAAGVDIGTGGNHTFAKPEADELYRQDTDHLVRPVNFPGPVSGQGVKTFPFGRNSVTVINLLGEHAMAFPPSESPFKAMKTLLANGLPTADAIVVDMHAEATSEKVAMGWYLDGKASFVVGTHTHVPTADERILPHGTGYVTDLGMVGLRDSSLGVDRHDALARFLEDQTGPFDIPEHGPVVLHAVLATITEGHCTAIERIVRETEV